VWKWREISIFGGEKKHSTKMAGNLNCRGGRIPEILGRIMRTGGEELVKFLQDVLDALFAIFSTEDGNSTPHSGLVFHALGKHTSFYLILSYTKF
jgi:hypothetical protein